MSNMSYCRFENTLRDLQDCSEHMDSALNSATEEQARANIIELCVEIALGYGDEIGREVEEVD